jgi:superfamily II DNA or RNA helicase
VWLRRLPTPEIPFDAGIQDVFRILANDASRNRRIAQDVLSAYQEGRKIIVLTERTDHLELLRKALSDEVEHCFVLHGRLSKRQRATIFAELAGLCDQAPRILMATGRLVGEGFDYPPLDTMVLAMPISWKGTLQQYAGRLLREYSFKQDVRIYDYVEHDQPRLARMWDKRQRGYRAMGYRFRCADEFDLGKPVKVK